MKIVNIIRDNAKSLLESNKNKTDIILGSDWLKVTVELCDEIIKLKEDNKNDSFIRRIFKR